IFSIVSSDFAGTNQQNIIWNVDANGAAQSASKTIVSGLTSPSTGELSFADGSYLVTNTTNTANADMLLTKVKADGTIDWSKKYTADGQQLMKMIVPTLEGGYAIAGISNISSSLLPDSNNVFLVKVDSIGNGRTCSGEVTGDVTITNTTFTIPLTSVGG